MAPAPPSGFGFNNPKYPSAGNLQNRIISHRELNRDLEKVYIQNSIVCLNATNILTDFIGSLDLAFTSDECNVNSRGSILVKKFILEEIGKIYF